MIGYWILILIAGTPLLLPPGTWHCPDYPQPCVLIGSDRELGKPMAFAIPDLCKEVEKFTVQKLGPQVVIKSCADMFVAAGGEK